MAEKKGAGGKPQEYNEENGQYGAKTWRQNASYSDILSKTGIEKKEKTEKLTLIPEKVYGFDSKERRETKHHIAHAKEMGYKNQKEYERAAIEFFNGTQGTLYFSQERKRWYKYDEKTELFCVSSDGIIHTFSRYSKNKFNKIKRQDKLDGR